MSPNGDFQDLPGVEVFIENRNKYPSEEMLALAGRYVAWTPDGTRILASAEDREGVDEKLASMGIHFSQVVHDYIDPL